MLSRSLNQRFSIRRIRKRIMPYGLKAGQLVVSVEFAGCSLWQSGLGWKRGMSQGSCARFCDANVSNGHVYDISGILDAIDKCAGNARSVLLTGGEPGEQVTQELVDAMRIADGRHIMIETMGAFQIPEDLYAIVSPKKNPEGGAFDLHPTVRDSVGEIHVILPGWSPDEMELLVKTSGVTKRKFVRPQDPLLSDSLENTFLTASMDDEDDSNVLALAATAYQNNVNACVNFLEKSSASWDVSSWALSLDIEKLSGTHGKAST